MLSYFHPLTASLILCKQLRSEIVEFLANVLNANIESIQVASLLSMVRLLLG